jgi:hypothetical protein
MRRVAGAFKTTLIKALEAETELMSTKQQLYNKHRKYAVRMLQVTETHNIRQCIYLFIYLFLITRLKSFDYDEANTNYTAENRQTLIVSFFVIVVINILFFK